MSTVLSAGPFFEVLPGWLPTAQHLREASLPAGPLAAIMLDVARIRPAGKWHPVSPGAVPAGCVRVRRAVADSRALTRRQAGLLAGLELCRACTAQVRPRGRAGAYLDLARHIIAARAWTQALEQAAPSADWPACLRWTARTPFTDENVLGLIEALAGDPSWEPARQAGATAWQELRDRADTAQDQARVAAGPPGLRAHAAAACALVAAQQDTIMENEIIGAISSAKLQWRNVPVPSQAWGAASRAWAETICLDADPAAARTALADAVEQIYATAQVRDVALLPTAPAYSGDEFSSPAEWAHAEYQAVRAVTTRRWYQRLEAALAEVHDQADDAASQWRLLLIIGWPPAAEGDRELAYLAHYPELIRTPQVPTPASGSECPSRAIVLLHVPGFAARHAVAHQSPNLTATMGAQVAAGSTPSPGQISALLRYAAAIHGRHNLTEASAALGSFQVSGE
ncbi:MAG TPA: hypothetical protein VN695_04610 [Streptosporangiaceae bacterium]|nr:hypothetical protein [Streptosporangiaceae bacterium]